jgi:glycosyltransferase involved in cell wall biosynthesis
MAPNISVVMTSYNRNEQLWRTLGSFWPQNVDDLEVIVVDDSTEEPWPMNMDQVVAAALKAARDI